MEKGFAEATRVAPGSSRIIRAATIAAAVRIGTYSNAATHHFRNCQPVDTRLAGLAPLRDVEPHSADFRTPVSRLSYNRWIPQALQDIFVHWQSAALAKSRIQFNAIRLSSRPHEQAFETLFYLRLVESF